MDGRSNQDLFELTPFNITPEDGLILVENLRNDPMMQPS